MPSVCNLLDCLLAARLNNSIEIFIPRDPTCSVYVGGRPFTQCLDIAHGAQLTIEKGLDLRSTASTSQADVRQFFDYPIRF